MKQKFKPIINHLYDPVGCRLNDRLKDLLDYKLYYRLKDLLYDTPLYQLYNQTAEVIENETEV